MKSGAVLRDLALVSEFPVSVCSLSPHLWPWYLGGYSRSVKTRLSPHGEYDLLRVMESDGTEMWGSISSWIINVLHCNSDLEVKRPRRSLLVMLIYNRSLSRVLICHL